MAAPRLPLKLEAGAASEPAQTALAVHALQVLQEADERVEHAQQELRAAANDSFRSPKDAALKGKMELRIQAHAIALEAQRKANIHLQECLALEKVTEDRGAARQCRPVVKEEPAAEDSEDSLDIPDWKLKPRPDHYVPAPRRGCKAEPPAFQETASAGGKRYLSKEKPAPTRRCKLEPPASWRRAPVSRPARGSLKPYHRLRPAPQKRCKIELQASWRKAPAEGKRPREEHPAKECTARQLKILRKTQTCCDWDPARYCPERVMGKWGHRLQYLPPDDLFFCHAQISRHFRSSPHRGQPLDKLLEDLISEKVCPLDITPLVGVEDEAKIWVVCGNRRLFVLRKFSQQVRDEGGEILIPIYVHKKSSAKPLPDSLFAKYVEASSTKKDGDWPSFFPKREICDSR
ncbi:unnamed protein product [Symbiodinium natans]|uniref:Uncharacterized protein n=1 Tax=Symbiodinium natans TaxID=878477 RepID=A0A812GR33_9DINO|nr:unnamed protein product [Symbiodinium natans]